MKGIPGPPRKTVRSPSPSENFSRASSIGSASKSSTTMRPAKCSTAPTGCREGLRAPICPYFRLDPKPNAQFDGQGNVISGPHVLRGPALTGQRDQPVTASFRHDSVSAATSSQRKVLARRMAFSPQA